MSKSVMKLFLYVAVAVLFTAAMGLAQKAKSLNIYSDSVLPNGQELKAGKYQVAVNDSSKQVEFKQGKKVVATAPCTIVEKPVKNPCDEIKFNGNTSKPQLQELQFGGEHRSILLIQ